MTKFKKSKVISSNEKKLRNKLFDSNTSDEEMKEVRRKLKKYGWK